MSARNLRRSAARPPAELISPASPPYRRRSREARLIVTDGWVGRPSGLHRRSREPRLAVAFLGTGINGQDLREVADFTAVLKCGD
jgi:hypothetical protein